MRKKRGFRSSLKTKKGQGFSLMFTVMFEIILVACASAFLFFLVRDLVNNNLMLKKFYSGDIAMTTAAIYAAPGNVQYTYKMDALSSKRFYFEIRDSMVYVGDAKKYSQETQSDGNTNNGQTTGETATGKITEQDTNNAANNGGSVNQK